MEKILFYVIFKDSNSGNRRVPNRRYGSMIFQDRVEEYDVSGQNRVAWHFASEFGVDGIFAGMEVGIFQLFTYRLGDRQMKEYYNQYSPKYDLNNSQLILHDVIFYLKVSPGIDASNQINNLVYELNEASNAYSSRSAKVVSVPQIVYVGSPSHKQVLEGYSQPIKPYIVTVDHGQITIDPNAPYYDHSGDGAVWVDPSNPSPDYPHHE